MKQNMRKKCVCIGRCSTVCACVFIRLFIGMLDNGQMIIIIHIFSLLFFSLIVFLFVFLSFYSARLLLAEAKTRAAC